MAAIGAPTLVGTITHPSAEDIRNTVVVWDPTTGPGPRHDKVFLQPFGEYMPYREFFAKLSPYANQAGNFTAGDGNGVVDVTLKGGEVLPIGVATCYEVAFDAAYDHAIAAGAQLLVTPTNNATFGFTDMTYQQLAMSRMRALEFHRSVVVSATSGVSATITPQGEVLQRTKIFKAAAIEDSLPLSTVITPAVYVATWGERAVALLGLLCVLLALVMGRRSRSFTSTPRVERKARRRRQTR